MHENLTNAYTLYVNFFIFYEKKKQSKNVTQDIIRK